MIVCEQCRYFKPDRINPAAGIGRCVFIVSHGAFFPAEKHLCRDFAPIDHLRPHLPRRL